jgi:hypothetical protein
MPKQKETLKKSIADLCKSCNIIKLHDEFIDGNRKYKLCHDCRLKRRIYGKRYYHRHKGLTRIYTPINDPIKRISNMDFSQCLDNDIKEKIESIFNDNNIDTIDKAKFLLYDLIKYEMTESE